MLVLFNSDVEKYEDFVQQLEKEKNISLNIDYLIDDFSKDYYKVENLWTTIEIDLEKELKKKKIDLIGSIPTTYLYKPINNSLLESFEPYIQKNDFDLTNLHKPVVDISRKVGQGDIFFLSPSFNNRMLIINNDIFNKLGIPVPTKALTWSEVYDLSFQIKSKIKDQDQKLYPISLGPGGKTGLFMDFQLLVSTKELPLINKSSNIYPNDEWDNLVHKFVTLFQTNGTSDDLDIIDDLFFQGQVAMKIFYPFNLNILYGKYSAAELGYKLKKFNYTLLPAPSFEDDREMTYVDTKNLAISKNSGNKEAAWEVIEFAMSKEYASFMANSERNAFEGKFTSYYDNEILKIYEDKYPGIDPSTFYVGEKGQIKPEEFTEKDYYLYHELARKYFPEMVENKLTTKVALERIRDEFNKQSNREKMD